MRAHRIKQASRIAIVAILAIAIVACGGDDGDAIESTGTGEESATGSVTTEAPTTPSGTTTGTDPCDPIATLVTVVVNDRCTLVPGEVPQPEQYGTAFQQSTSAWKLDNCPGLLATPNEMIVTTDPGVPLEPEVTRVIDVLDAAGIGAGPGAELAPDSAIVDLIGDPTIEEVLNQLPALQGVGASVDLNYLEPVLPNNRFRPADDPMPASAAQIAEFTGSGFTGADGKTVAVIDTTSDVTVYDTDGNNYNDEDHGHGRAVQSIVERATEATVMLYPVVPNSTTNNPSLTSGRWAPMLIQDSDIIAALQSVDPIPNVVNMSLGGVGCAAGTDFVYGVGERLALARKMNNLRLAGVDSEIAVEFVAAAGNNGEDVLHFPAAWRNEAVATELTNAIVNAVDPSDNVAVAAATAIKDEVDLMRADLGLAIYAVGSVERDQTTTSPFSNCGSWVNAAAFGNQQVGVYPVSTSGADAAPTADPTIDFAVWSGTSFATANFTAALVSGLQLPDPVTGAQLTGPAGLKCPPQAATATTQPPSTT